MQEIQEKGAGAGGDAGAGAGAGAVAGAETRGGGALVVVLDDLRLLEAEPLVEVLRFLLHPAPGTAPHHALNPETCTGAAQRSMLTGSQLHLLKNRLVVLGWGPYGGTQGPD